MLLAALLLASTAYADDEYKSDYCKKHWGPVRGCYKRVHRPWRPVFTMGLEGGAGHFDEGGPGKFNSGFGNATTAGGAWGGRVGIDFFSWLGLEARYLGMFNKVHGSYGTDLSYVTSAGILDVRIGIPIPYVHPYVFSGIGVYDVHLRGSDTDRSLTVLKSGTQPGVPIGAGIDVPLNWHISLAVEATYHFQIGESFAKTTLGNVDGGDFSTVTGVFRVRL